MSESSERKLSTEPYKGVRDFYPEEKAIQNYMFEVWKRTAESFGYEEYDASIFEPAELYRSKGAVNEEMVNDQTYTFLDRGEREVTLRPEMTPTVARMIAAKQKELAFPVRWYSIPNLFRYERAQRGRLREHWQLNCDIFGSRSIAADIEIIALANQIIRNFGADPEMFEIRLNDRSWINDALADFGLDAEQSKQMLTLLDRKEKIDNFDAEAEKICGKQFSLNLTEPPSDSDLARVIAGLKELGIENVILSPSTVRGFDYYTGTIFEFFDTDPHNARSLLGGGRYDDLTGLFGGESVPGVGFGLGDVTMRDFLETHGLLTADITAPDIVIIPMEEAQHIAAQKLAQAFRANGLSASVDISTRKIGKKLTGAADALITFALVLGEDEIQNESYTVKNLVDGTELSGSFDDLIEQI